MTRALLPGRWNRDRSRAIPDAQACELDCDLGPSAYRVIAPPPPLTEDARARFKRRALYLAALAFAALGGLLGIAHARWEP